MRRAVGFFFVISLVLSLAKEQFSSRGVEFYQSNHMARPASEAAYKNSNKDGFGVQNFELKLDFLSREEMICGLKRYGDENAWLVS